MLLGIPWLYSINARIFIQNLTIELRDLLASKTVRKWVDLELIFYQDYNLLLYFCKTLPKRVSSTTFLVLIDDSTKYYIKSDKLNSKDGLSTDDNANKIKIFCKPSMILNSKPRRFN